MIKAHEITKSFGDISVLRGLSLDIERGGIYGIAGRSGAGKSTLLRCINGLEKHDGGSMIVDGTDVSMLSPGDLRSFRKNTGMIFQHFSLLERLTVFENIALPLRCWKYKQTFIDKKVRELLDVVGISEKKMQKPGELSGGQKQRVAIARALSLEPHIMLCDEATSALDPKTSKTIIALLKEINREMGITIVFVIHQMPVVKDLCRNMAIIEHGRVAVSGTVDEIFRLQPAALKNLMGEDTAPSDDTKSIILFLPESSNDSVIPQMSSELGIDLIIRGESSSQNKKNNYTISFAEREFKIVKKYLNAKNVSWKESGKEADLKGYEDKQRDIYQPDMSVILPGIV